MIAVVSASALALAADGGARRSDGLEGRLADADAVVLEITRSTLDASVVAACDRRAVRIVPLSAGPADARLAESFGLEPALALEVEAWQLAERLTARPVVHPTTAADDEPSAASRRPRLIAVWGPAGAPGRSTVAIELAVELSRGGRHVALVDADSHAPSLALALGLADEAPGFAAACRQAELGGLDGRELTRISAPLGTAGVDVLTGLNRPSRWPELSAPRVAAALAACRDWADYTVVDVASSLERDEEIVSDIDGPRRNAATLVGAAGRRSRRGSGGRRPARDLTLPPRAPRAAGDDRSDPGRGARQPASARCSGHRRARSGAPHARPVRRDHRRHGSSRRIRAQPMRRSSPPARSPRSPRDRRSRSAIRRFVGEAVAPVGDAGRGIRRSSRRREAEPSVA